MRIPEDLLRRLCAVPDLTVSCHVPLSRYTRFGIGGPADVLVETANAESFAAALRFLRSGPAPLAVIGSGTNLVVADDGFRGTVLRYTGKRIEANNTLVTADAGAELQDLVDFAIKSGLAGLETMTGIPGSVGAAVYGNAGAYGHSISEFVELVRFFDGEAVRELDAPGCRFRYRESIFKSRKEWIVLSVGLALRPADPAELRRIAGEIRQIRDRKYPPTMRCAGSIFKNLLLAELPEPVARQVPEQVIREGKVPSAWFLEQVGAKGMRRGDIQVADYHANLIYNDGNGSAADLRAVINELKYRVWDRFGLEVEEEVQFVGFGGEP